LTASYLIESLTRHLQTATVAAVEEAARHYIECGAAEAEPQLRRPFAADCLRAALHDALDSAIREEVLRALPCLAGAEANWWQPVDIDGPWPVDGVCDVGERHWVICIESRRRSRGPEAVAIQLSALARRSVGRRAAGTVADAPSAARDDVADHVAFCVACAFRDRSWWIRMDEAAAAIVHHFLVPPPATGHEASVLIGAAWPYRNPRGAVGSQA
jgi:hypothetical protein